MARDKIVIGLADVQREFAALPARLGTAIKRRGLLAGTVPVRTEARRRVRKRSGELAKHIVSSTRRDPPGAKGASREYYASVYIKKGKKRIRVLRRGVQQRDKSGRFTKKTGDNSREILVNPRRYGHLEELGSVHSRGSGFMRGALDSKADEAVGAIATKTREELNKELAKARAAGGKGSR